MNEELILHYVVLAISTLMLLVLWKRLWRDLGTGSRIVLGFTLGMYALTYLGGTILLFIGREALIEHYYSGALRAPNATPYGALLTLAALPIPVVSLSLWLFRRRRRVVLPDPDNGRDGGWSDRLAVVMTMGFALFLTRGLVAELMENALSGIAETGGLVDLYARRMATFETMSALQGGMVYGTIPACAAMLLFQRSSLWRYLGAGIAALALVLNIGLFQIGPLLVFGLTALTSWLLLSNPRQFRQTLVIAAIIGCGLFVLYQGLKGDASGTVLTHLLLRMPIGLPYLWEYSQIAPLELVASSSLSHDLGEYMFPELRRFERFVAMPQPAFVAAYFQYGPAASVALLCLVGFGVALVGRLLDRFWQRRHRVWIAVAFTPAMYYVFQVSLTEVLLSSYSFVFSVLPVVISLGLRLLFSRNYLQPVIFSDRNA